MEAALKNEKYIQQNPSNQELTRLVTKTSDNLSEGVHNKYIVDNIEEVEECILGGGTIL
jgi:hypothetical protein